MKQTNRSSKQQLKIPIRFEDTIHELNGKLKNSKNKDKKKGVSDEGRYKGKEGSGNGVDNKAKDANMNMDPNVVNRKGNEVDSQNGVDGCILEDVTPMIPKVNTTNVSPTPKTINVPISTQANPVKQSYAKITTKFKVFIDSKLKIVPTGMDENGDEYVIFDDELINEGSSKWNLTLCGYFVGHKMHINVLRYNIRRMWSRYGLKEVIENDCGMFSSSFIMKKWDINISIDKTEPDKLPLWVRLCNLPLEAWSINGISALSSRIGKPLIMDAMTASMCKHGTGRIGYARVLIEVQAKKDLPEKIDVVYQNALKETIGHKTLQVRYDWTPLLCTECGVFGHSQDKCKKDAKEQNISSTGNEGSSDEQGKNNDGFVKLQSKKAKKHNEVSAKAATTQTVRDADKVGCCDNNGRTDDGFTVVQNRKLDKQNGLKQGKPRNQFIENNWNNGGETDKYLDPSARKNIGTDTLSQSYKFEVLNEYEEGELNEMEVESNSRGLDSMNLGEIQGKEGSSNGVDNEAKDANMNMDPNVVNGKGNEVDSQNEVDGCILENVTPMIPKVNTTNVSPTPKTINVPISTQAYPVKQSYANITTKFEVLIDNKLKTIPTGMDENCDEYMIFDDELINEGSSKWNLTLCGYFVGHKMHINFHHEKGLNEVVEKGPWMVIYKPLVVQKWDINMSIDKTEPDKLPLWDRLCNLPLEAWSINGISALASRIGKPLIMDAMTASMCKHGTGRIGYARVLVEVQAKKDLPEKIDDVYQNALKETIGHKTLQVRYDWTPPLCTECGVFGHSQDKCKKDAKEQNVSSTGNEGSSDEQGKNDDGFVKVKVRRLRSRMRTGDSFTVVQNRKLDKHNGLKQGEPRNQFMENNWNNGGGNRQQHKTGINGSAGKNTGTDTPSQSYKFEVLNEYEEGKLNEMEGMQNREQVDVFISLKKHQTAEEMKEWNNDMVCYFRKRLELLIDNDVLNIKADVQNENSSKEMDDVCGVYDGIAKEMNWEDRRGRDSSVLQVLMLVIRGAELLLDGMGDI
ncbi:zinc knuckle CX2CX4HX4C containing protein [Tanacetum coccineum]